jgi:prevent-host-death family protein
MDSRRSGLPGKTPLIVPVSELRRDTARLIFRMERSHVAVFITQRGYVTAVLLTREDYDELCVLRDKGLKAIGARMPVGDQMPSVREVEDRPDYWDDW